MIFFVWLAAETLECVVNVTIGGADSRAYEVSEPSGVGGNDGNTVIVVVLKLTSLP